MRHNHEQRITSDWTTGVKKTNTKDTLGHNWGNLNMGSTLDDTERFLVISCDHGVVLRWEHDLALETHAEVLRSGVSRCLQLSFQLFRKKQREKGARKGGGRVGRKKRQRKEKTEEKSKCRKA